MPAESILEEIRHDSDFDHMGWDALLRGFMFTGIEGDAKLMPREIDGERLDGKTAWRHLQALSGSFQPKHEHKEAAFSVLCKEFWEWGIWHDGAGNVHKAGDWESLDEEDLRELGF